MVNFIPQRAASIGLIILFSLLIVFHGFAILGVIPYEMLWGGRLTGESQMLVFETISIWLNLIMLGIVVIHAGLWKINISPRITIIALWAMTALFLLNTIGNLVSKNQLEKMIFTPVTLVLFMLCLRLATAKPPTQDQSQ